MVGYESKNKHPKRRVLKEPCDENSFTILNKIVNMIEKGRIGGDLHIYVTHQ